jgi:hypothetical protein
VERSYKLLLLRSRTLFRPGYHNNLVSNWLPALDGVIEKLQRGAKVADIS